MLEDTRNWLMVIEALQRYRKPQPVLQTVEVSAQENGDREDEPALYEVSPDGVATLGIIGPMEKYASWAMMFFGGTSSEWLRAAIRQATEDPEVDGIFLRVDSPGGEVAGTEELADAVWLAARSDKPIHAHIEDFGASAALWVAAQANRVTANSTAEVGSIGTVVTIPDTVKMWEEMGVEWHVVSSGSYKGLLMKPEVTEETVAYLQEIVDALTERFQAAMIRGRGFSRKEIRALSNGKMHIAAEAEALGLIDAVSGREAAYDALSVAAQSYREERFAEARGRGRRRAATIGKAKRILKERA